MFDLLQVLTVLIVFLAATPAMAHALELPGKMRLNKDAYFAIQRIYYPGFTFAGIAEPAGVISTLSLLFLMPVRNVDFWLTFVALAGLIGMQAVYWVVTHPVNRFWVEGQQLSRAGRGFFSFAAAPRAGSEGDTYPVEWTKLRDRWEYSHVVRAGLSTMSLIALVMAIP